MDQTGGVRSFTGMDIITGMENRNGHYAMVLDGLNIYLSV